MFKKRNEEFVCLNCGESVPPHPSSSRDHCNHCLYGLHVDNEPGDRANNCRGVLEPVGFRKKGNKDQIVYKCRKCDSTLYCVLAPDDDFDAVIDVANASV